MTARKASTPGPVAKGDRHLWGIYILLVFIGIIEMYSASSRLVRTENVYNPVIFNGAIIFAGLVIIWFLQRTHYKKIIKWAPGFAVASVALMLLTLVVGDNINSATRSINLIVFTLQPSEFLKLSAAIMVAYFTAKNQKEGGGVENRGIVQSALLIMFYGMMLAPQGLTNTLLLMSISLSMMLIGGIEIKKIAIVVGVYVLCFLAYLGVTHMSSSHADSSSATATKVVEESGNRTGVWADRLATYFGNGRPKYEQPVTSDNMQEMVGYMAQANGGLIGVGPGNSRETARLSLAHTDYIYAIIVEELGFVGGMVVLVLYLWLLGRASAIAGRCKRAFPSLLVIGMALTIVYQALFHICIVTGVYPVSGQPLPLISKGGTSVIITSIAFGIMLSVSRFAVTGKGSKTDMKNEVAALPSDMAAENPSQLNF